MLTYPRLHISKIESFDWTDEKDDSTIEDACVYISTLTLPIQIPPSMCFEPPLGLKKFQNSCLITLEVSENVFLYCNYDEDHEQILISIDEEAFDHDFQLIGLDNSLAISNMIDFISGMSDKKPDALIKIDFAQKVPLNIKSGIVSAISGQSRKLRYPNVKFKS